MMLPDEMDTLQAAFTALQHLLGQFDDRGVIIGGVASGFLGKPRLTVDIDAVFLLSVDEIPRLLQAAEVEGIKPRLENVVEFARQNRVLLLRHAASGVNIDISLGILPFEEEMVTRSVVHRVGALSLRLPTPEDLIIIKAVAHRPKDLLDIQAIAENNPDLDLARIQYWVQVFAQALDQPDLWQELQAFLQADP
jgi:hypothetical protein